MSGRCFVATFGCRVNQADSEGILETLREKDLTPAESHLDADVVVINSCTVTHRSDADIRKLVNRVQRENPHARVVVTGCYAQRDPQALVKLRGTAAVVGHSDSHRLGEVVDRLLKGPPASDGAPLVFRTAMDAVDPDDLPPVDPVALVHDRTRPFVKIQDGCDAACTYCVIPSVRGPARSAGSGEIVRAVRRLADSGYFEVVITGVHLGTYGQLSGDTLAALTRRILSEVPGLGRLRMSCIEPMAFPLELADIAREDKRLAPHFHLPLQSGSDRVLKRMARPYRAQEYRAILAAIRERVPDVCLGTDVIVGFPGETGEEFDETCRFVETSGLDYVHVFSYSDRPGVPSTRLRGKVAPVEIKRRATELIGVGERLWTGFLDRQIGRTVDALTIQRREEDGAVVEALSDHYCPIFARDEGRVFDRNVPVRARIERREGGSVWATLSPRASL